MLFFFFFSAKICMRFLNFGSDSILIHGIYFYFSYNPHKTYIRDIPFFEKKKKEKDNMANGVVI